MENLENYCQQYIYKNREKWFEGEMELHDIENYFTSPLKLFKSGKYYLARTNITVVLGKPALQIYDGNEKEVDFENIGDDTNVMTILEIQGIKCSAKSFQIEIELKQMMVLQSTNIFEKCIIKNEGNIAIKSVDEKFMVRELNLEIDSAPLVPILDDRMILEETDMVVDDESVPRISEADSETDNENIIFKTDKDIPGQGAKPPTTNLVGDRRSPDKFGDNVEEGKDIVIDIPFSVDSLRTTAGGSRLQASLADPNGLSMENRRFAPPGGSVGVPKEPNLESLRAPSALKVEDLRFSDRGDSLAKRPNLSEDAAKDPLIDEEKILETVEFDGLEEVEFHLEELTDQEPLVIKKRDNVYYEMYKEAKKKAKIARDLALSAYLEAKRIKNTYMLEDLVDDDSDEDSEEESDDEDSDEESEDSDEVADDDEDVNNVGFEG
jgi:hypothetical protein